MSITNYRGKDEHTKIKLSITNYRGKDGYTKDKTVYYQLPW